MNNRRVIGMAHAGGVAVMLAACTSLPPDRGASVSNEWLAARSSVDGRLSVGQLSAAQALPDEAFSSELDADAAVRVALTNSPLMRGLYAQLGIAQAQAYDASRLSNPSLGFMQLSGDGGQRRTWSVTQRFTELLFINYHTRAGQSEVLQAQQQVAQAVLELEKDVRSAYYRMLGAELVQQLHQQLSEAAGVSRDYAQSLYDAGNISELQLGRERAAAVRARIDWQLAQSAAMTSRSELMTLMGLSLLDTRAHFQQTLEVPVAQTLEVSVLQGWAVQQRMDLALLQEQWRQAGATHDHVRRWFWLDDAELQLERETETDGAVLRGIGGSVGVPLFNQGGGARLRATAQMEALEAQLQALQMRIRNDVAAQVQALVLARDNVELYRNELVPLQARMTELTQQQQNFMLVGTLELLSVRQESLQAYQHYLDATAEYWVRHAELAHTLGGRFPPEAGDAAYGISVGVEALPSLPASDAQNVSAARSETLVTPAESNSSEASSASEHSTGHSH